jgi:hypothetical protein
LRVQAAIPQAYTCCACICLLRCSAYIYQLHVYVPVTTAVMAAQIEAQPLARACTCYGNNAGCINAVCRSQLRVHVPVMCSCFCAAFIFLPVLP